MLVKLNSIFSRQMLCAGAFALYASKLVKLTPDDISCVPLCIVKKIPKCIFEWVFCHSELLLFRHHLKEFVELYGIVNVIFGHVSNHRQQIFLWKNMLTSKYKIYKINSCHILFMHEYSFLNIGPCLQQTRSTLQLTIKMQKMHVVYFGIKVFVFVLRLFYIFTKRCRLKGHFTYLLAFVQDFSWRHWVPERWGLRPRLCRRAWRPPWTRPPARPSTAIQSER